MTDTKIPSASIQDNHISAVLLQTRQLGLAAEAESRIGAAAMAAALRELAATDAGFNGVIYVGEMQASADELRATTASSAAYERIKWRGGLLMRQVKEDLELVNKLGLQPHVDQILPK